MARKYLIDRTPKVMRCIVGLCPAVYEVKRECGIGACPAVYEKPENEECIVGSCPTVQEKTDGHYIIIGRELSSKEIADAGLAAKVSKDETVIEVPKSLLDNL